MTTTITIHDKTKGLFLEYGRMDETYDDVINRMFKEVENKKTVDKIRDKISKYGEVAKETFDCEYREAMASIHMLRWVLNEENDATGDEVK